MSHSDELPDPATVTLRRRIEWIDTDAAGIYHYTTTFRLAEAAEAAMHRALGIIDGTFPSMPRLGVEMTFKRPLRFDDEVEATLAVAALGRSSVRYAFTLTGPGGLAAEGRVTTCLVDGTMGRAMPLPEDVRRRLASGGRLEAG